MQSGACYCSQWVSNMAEEAPHVSKPVGIPCSLTLSHWACNACNQARPLPTWCSSNSSSSSSSSRREGPASTSAAMLAIEYRRGASAGRASSRSAGGGCTPGYRSRTCHPMSHQTSVQSPVTRALAGKGLGCGARPWHARRAAAAGVSWCWGAAALSPGHAGRPYGVIVAQGCAAAPYQDAHICGRTAQPAS